MANRFPKEQVFTYPNVDNYFSDSGKLEISKVGKTKSCKVSSNSKVCNMYKYENDINLDFETN